MPASEGGIADALRLAERFVGNDRLAVVLGDNIVGGSLRTTFEAFQRQKRRNSGQSAVVLTDIDFFKKINDQYGHIQGDSVLLDKIKNSGRVEIILGSQPVEIKGEQIVESVVLKNKKKQEIRQIAVGGVFIEIGLVPNSDFAKKILKLNQKGEIITDCDCGTSVPGIYAAGDVTNVRGKQIIIASGEGAKAALSVYKYLLEKK